MADPRESVRVLDFDEFAGFLAKCLDEDPELIEHDTSLVDDLGVRSIQMVELAVSLCDLLGLDIDDAMQITDGTEFVEASETVGSLHRYYCELSQRPLARSSRTGTEGTDDTAHDSANEASAEGVSSKKAAFSPSRLRMAGGRVWLRPIMPMDHQRLYMLQTSEETGFRWRYGGVVPPFEVFVREIHSGVHAQFVVSTLRKADVLGLVVAYQANPRSGTVYAGVVMAPELVGSGIGIEAVGLFINYLFSTWSFRKVYFEALEFTYETIADAVPDLIEVEGVLKEHHFYQGRYFDQYILSISREKFTRYYEDLTGAVSEDGVEMAGAVGHGGA